MAKFVRRAIDKIRSVLAGRRKPPVPPTLPGRQTVARGHRGVALGSQADPDLSPENIAKWRTLNEQDVRDFVHGGQPLFVHSSNVVMVQYHPEAQAMMVEYKKGRAYMYYNVSQWDAYSFAGAASKGSWIWDVFRIRGTKNGHRKPFQRIR